MSLQALKLEILDYWKEHPEAQDTLEGVIEWWLMEQRIRYVTTEVQQALDELVKQGSVLLHPGPDGRIRYALSPPKAQELQSALINKSPTNPTQ